MNIKAEAKQISPFALLIRYPLAAYFLLAFALFWGMMPLATISPTLPLLLGVFTPTVAMMIVCGMTGGTAEVKRVLHRVLIWRVGMGWVVEAFTIPLVCGIMTWLAAKMMGINSTPQFMLLPMGILFVLLALGEEIGWRGYALPKLIDELNVSPLLASLILGVIHALFHLPLWFTPGMTPPIYSFASFLVTSLCFGLLWTWLNRNTNGSVWIAALFHGSINLFGNIFYLGIPSALLNWLMPAGYLLVAVVVLKVAGASLTNRTRSDPL